jgi:hypothetical protein
VVQEAAIIEPSPTATQVAQHGAGMTVIDWVRLLATALSMYTYWEGDFSALMYPSLATGLLQL